MTSALRLKPNAARSRDVRSSTATSSSPTCARAHEPAGRLDGRCFEGTSRQENFVCSSICLPLG